MAVNVLCILWSIVSYLVIITSVLSLSNSGVDASPEMKKQHPNVLFIMTDQQRFDAFRRVQDELPQYHRRLKIRTPHLDHLSRDGVYFRRCYTQCPVCGPARVSLRTGCTIERTGVQTNRLVEDQSWPMKDIFQDKMDGVRSLDQVLVEDYGYVSEYYGKFHLPERFHYYSNTNSSESPATRKRVIQNNDYNYGSDKAFFSTGHAWQAKLKRYLNYAEYQLKAFTTDFAHEGDQRDTYTNRPYKPIFLDSRFGYSTDTDLRGTDVSFSHQAQIQPSVKGEYSLDENQTATFYNTDVALRALDRFAAETNDPTPWLLTVSYHHPHPPMMATPKFLKYYWEHRDKLLVPPNHVDPLSNSGYRFLKKLRYLKSAGYDNATAIQEWTALYYALVEEIDYHIGVLLDRVEQHGWTNNTLVIFTSDHGEMLGAHQMRGKNKFLEESARVPLVMKLPESIEAGTIVEEAVSHLDIFSTILDYVGAASESDESDGTSLRRYIEKKAFNADFEENVVVSEWDYRQPVGENELTVRLDNQPNFSVWHKGWKMMIHKRAESPKIDMMYNLNEDPFEMRNLIGLDGLNPSIATDKVIGKAEHLRILLLEWMQRLNGDSENEQYFSHPRHNALEGRGDVIEIRERRKWRRLDLWCSEHDVLFFGSAPVWNGTHYVRNEYLYLGRQTPGITTIQNLSVVGNDSGYFALSNTLELDNNTAITSPPFLLMEQDYVRIQITYSNPTRLDALELENLVASVHIRHDAETVTSPISVIIAFIGSTKTKEPTMSPSPTEIPSTSSPTYSISPTMVPLVPFVVPVRNCSPLSPCERCEGHCEHDDECEQGLVCSQKGGKGQPVPGCLGTDLSRTEWCILPTMTKSPYPTVSLVPSRAPNRDALHLLKPVVNCSPDDPCDRCQGHCENDEECKAGLVCSQKGGKGMPVLGCIGIDNSRTEWCVLPSLSLEPSWDPTESISPSQEPTASQSPSLLRASEILSVSSMPSSVTSTFPTNRPSSSLLPSSLPSSSTFPSSTPSLDLSGSPSSQLSTLPSSSIEPTDSMVPSTLPSSSPSFAPAIPVPFVTPVRNCSPADPCERCAGHCESDDECLGGLVCSQKGGKGMPVPGCIGMDPSRTEWCVLPSGTVSPYPSASRTPTTAPNHDPIPFLIPVLNCSRENPCGRCQGHCASDEECKDGLVCSQKGGRGMPVVGCNGVDNSRTEWCILRPTLSPSSLGLDPRSSLSPTMDPPSNEGKNSEAPSSVLIPTTI